MPRPPPKVPRRDEITSSCSSDSDGDNAVVVPSQHLDLGIMSSTTLPFRDPLTPAPTPSPLVDQLDPSSSSKCSSLDVGFVRKPVTPSVTIVSSSTVATRTQGVDHEVPSKLIFGTAPSPSLTSVSVMPDLSLDQVFVLPNSPCPEAPPALPGVPPAQPSQRAFSVLPVLPALVALPVLPPQPRVIDETFISADVTPRGGSESCSESDDVFLGLPLNDISSDSSDSSDEEMEELEETRGTHEKSDFCGDIADEPGNFLYSGCPITTEESLISILSYAQSEKLSGEGLSRLLKLVELHCPKPNNCLKSLENIADHFKDIKTPIQSYFYCSLCLGETSSITDVCESCKDLSPSVDQILILSLVDQVSQLYQRPKFFDDIQYKFNRKKLNIDNLEDIYDGQVYKEAEKGILSDKNNISLMWSTDGIQPYESTNLDIWPLYLIINELPPEKRFKRENLVLAAVYVGKSKPHPNIFLKHVHNNVKLLNQGFKVNVPGQDEPLEVKACIICGTCDSPAKAVMFNQKFFNGFYSCPKCLSKGEKSEESEDVFVHPYEEDVVMRTEEDYEMCAQEAAEVNCHVPKSRRIAPNGIKGTSFLYLMVDSMITSTSIDTMHCVYLGVMDKMLDLWFSKKHREEEWSLYKVHKVVSSLLTSISPPHFIKRMPRPLDQKANYKAYELLIMLYYYLLPVLHGVMNQPYFHNFKLLVGGMSLLNKRSISQDDVQQAKALLNQFAKDFQELYGLRHMTFNLHILRHLHSVVEALGPAFFTSCFGFEDLNGKLCSLIHGSRFAGSQLSKAMFSFLHLPLLVYNLSDGNVKDFCMSLTNKWKKVRIIEKICENGYSVGKYCKLLDFPEWVTNSLHDHAFRSVFSFSRVKIRGHVITSEQYTKE